MLNKKVFKLAGIALLVSNFAYADELNSSNWDLSASNNASDVAKAIDGKSSTRWTTRKKQASGQTFTIDLNEQTTFNKVVLNTDDNPNDYPREYELEVSDNGNNWRTVVSNTGNSAETVIEFSEQTATYIKITQLGSSNKNWWSIHEMSIHSDDTNSNSSPEMLDSTAWSLSSTTQEDNLYNATDGDENSRWSTNSKQTSGQNFTIDLNQTESFNRIVLNSDKSPNDYPRSYAVSVSNDGNSWNTVKTGDGNGAETIIDFDDQVAGYIKIEQLGSTSRYWWSIHEVNVYFGDYEEEETTESTLPAGKYHDDIVSIADIDDEDILRSPGNGWSDSYSVGDACYCETTYDHDISDIKAETSIGTMTVYEACTLLGPGPGSDGRPVYNDVQCGNGPANDAGDEDYCPGRVDLGKAGCVQIGPTWKFP